MAGSPDDVSRVVLSAGSGGRTVKVIGSGHSFTGAAVADEVLLDITRMNSVGRVDAVTGEVDVEAGVAISTLNLELAKQGRALANMGDIAYQTIAGAVSTATHGTGRELTGIAGQLRAVSFVDGSGVHRTVGIDDPDPTTFRAIQVGVGALGVITSVRLGTVPAFVLHAVEEPTSVDSLLGRLDDEVAGNDHFEFFWMPHTSVALTKRNNRSSEPARPLNPLRHWYQRSFLENTAFGAVCALGKKAPVLIPRLAKVVAASGRLDYSDQSHRIFASPRRVRFVEMEYAIPREACRDALNDVRRMIDARGYRVNFPIEVRFTAADDALLSTAHGRPSAYIAVHMYKGMEFEPYFRSVAEIMGRYGGRPHWGKMHWLGVDELSALYPRWDEFIRIRRELDPAGIFENGYVRRVFGSNR
jgi:FAD-linked oxidoreductase